MAVRGNSKHRLGTPDGALLASIVFAVACAGCYEGEQLIEQLHSEANRAGLEEIDLGTYRTTMPRDEATATFTDMQFRIFGNVPRYHLETVRARIESDVYRLRHDMLSAVRQATPEELTDPDLTGLRERIADVVNEVLGEVQIDAIGFADVRFMRH